MQASIISIGDEILIGQIINTNASWMAQRLNEIGVHVYEVVTVSDTADHITQAVDQALQQADIVLLTGGLGPTKDDITKKTLADYFESGMEFHQEILDDLNAYMQKRGRPMLESVKSLALIPSKCEVIRNLKGTAAAMLFEKEGKILVSMPGVPYEMKDFMERVVLDRIKQQFNTPTILHKTIICAGQGETVLAEKIKSVTESLPPHIKMAYLPNMGIVRLRLSGSGEHGATLQAEIEDYTQQVWDILHPKYAIGYDKDKLEEIIGQILLEKKATLSTAESCTGGLVAHKITSISGSSRYFEGGAVCYSNRMKQELLGVQTSTLEQFGAVSEACVKEMAQGAVKNFNTTYGVAISGIAGPGGGTPEKPVGTVWIGVADKDRVFAKKLSFPRTRELVTAVSATMALVFLRRFMLEIV